MQIHILWESFINLQSFVYLMAVESGFESCNEKQQKMKEWIEDKIKRK